MLLVGLGTRGPWAAAPLREGGVTQHRVLLVGTRGPWAAAPLNGNSICYLLYGDEEG